MGGSSNMEKGLPGVDNSVGIARGLEEGIKGTNNNGESAIKINLKKLYRFFQISKIKNVFGCAAEFGDQSTCPRRRKRRKAQS